MTKPNLFYSDDWTKIYNNDCFDLLDKFPRHYFDLAFADPPYNVGKEYGEETDDEKSLKEYGDWCFNWLMKLIHCSKLVVVTPSKGKMKLWLQNIMYPTDTMIWIKKNSNVHSSYKVFKFMAWEPIMIYGKIEKADDRPAHDFIECPVSIQDDIGDHPCPKPRKLLTRIIDMLTQPNDKILDPFLGSGTTAFAAKQLQRRCIGIEIHKSYCENTVKRLAHEFLPLYVAPK